MNIRFNTDTIKPMAEWLLKRKHRNIRDEVRLREILRMPDYEVEFQRYGMPELPVCGISFEEAVDFFMNFDRKDFDNPRLQYKKESFCAFYRDIDRRMEAIGRFASFAPDDLCLMEELLEGGLPEECLKETPELNIILIISIGNSMGWPYGHYIDYDVANLDMLKSKADFIHVTAHEIHHIFTGALLFPDGINAEDWFLQNFAYEGLAVHYCNNLAAKGKPAKHGSCGTFAMQTEDMEFYEAHFDEIFGMIQNDYRSLKGRSVDEAAAVISERYERFDFMDRPIRQYPTYYFGCYMWGLVDLVYGKEKVFEAISDPPLFVKLYNGAAEEKYRLI